MRRRWISRAPLTRPAVILASAALAGPAALVGAAPAAASATWSTWRNMGGALSGAPDAASWGLGRVDVFGRGTDGHLHHRGYQTSVGSWSAYDDLGAISSDPTAASPRNGQLDVMATFSDHRMHQRTYRSGIGWSAWRTVPGVIHGSPDAASARDGSLNVVARDSANRLIFNWTNSAGTWRGWHVIGGVVSSDPSVVRRNTGSIDVFARGVRSDLQHVYWTPTGWHHESVGGVLGTGPDGASGTAGRVDVFAASPSGELWQRSWDSHYGWITWRRLSGRLTAAPGVASWGPGRLDLFVRSTSNVLYHAASPYGTTSSGSPSIVGLAGRYIGVGESPSGSNCTPFEPAGTCLPWCTYFATWVWHHANSALPALSYSGSVYSWAVANGRWKAGPSHPAPGDIVVYGSTPTTTVHTGIVESVGSGTITTIDGNYSDRVSRVGPFNPATATSPARILGYASPVPLSGSAGASTARSESGTMIMPAAPTLGQIRSQDGGR